MGTPDNYLDSPVKSIIFDEKGKYIFFSFFKIVRSAGGGPAANAGVLPPTPESSHKKYNVVRTTAEVCGPRLGGAP